MILVSHCNMERNIPGIRLNFFWPSTRYSMNYTNQVFEILVLFLKESQVYKCIFRLNDETS